jgi:hypothetical protein
MPIFNLICSLGHKKRVYRSAGWKSTSEELHCEALIGVRFGLQPCGERLVRDSGSSAPTTVVKEVIDNGVMVKSLERLADAERLHAEKTEIEDALAKGKDRGPVFR